MTVNLLLTVNDFINQVLTGNRNREEEMNKGNQWRLDSFLVRLLTTNDAGIYPLAEIYSHGVI